MLQHLVTGKTVCVASILEWRIHDMAYLCNKFIQDPCDFVPQMTRLVKGKQIDVNITWNVLSFGCTYSGIQPQVLVTVNFTQLDVSSDFPFVHVMLGNTNDTKEVVHTTGTPAMILPGENVVGFTKQHVLRRIKSQISATLGISDVSTLT